MSRMGLQNLIYTQAQIAASRACSAPTSLAQPLEHGGHAARGEAGDAGDARANIQD